MSTVPEGLTNWQYVSTLAYMTGMVDRPGAGPTADEALGRIIHMAMWDHGIKQVDFAPKLGIDQSALSKKLRGVRPWMFAEFIAAADLLNVDARDLLATMWGTAPTGAPTVLPATQPVKPQASPGKPERRKTHRLLRLVPVAA